jgi:CubicO group peptidase (beta-lactamase class C family)
MSLASPPGRDATVSWIIGQPLQFNPGAREAYSNIGYLLLGLIVEKYSGKAHIDFLRDEIFAPLGVPPDQILAGRTFPEDQDRREPYYDYAGDIDPNVFWPARGAGPDVPAPYGGWDHEARIGQGGVVASPLALLEYLDDHQVNGSSIGGARVIVDARNHTGSLEGTNALARQRADDVNFVVLFNKDPSTGSYAIDMRTAFDAFFNKPGIAWPSRDITTVDVGEGGDYNSDGFVEADDLLHWRLAFNRTPHARPTRTLTAMATVTAPTY